MVLITVRIPGDATLAGAMEMLGLSEQDVDTAYGLVSIDPAADLYGLRVNEDAARRVTAATTDAAGPFADPRIEPFGPPQ
ncbi:MAG TPA: hypothetical protein VIR33_10970 [Thermopolyspora sp.]|jgi:hypothetical protein